MGLMIGAGVAAIAGGIMGGLGEQAAAERRNQQAVNNWMQGEMQKGINNGKEIFSAVYKEGQQAKVNRSINMGAMKWGFDQKRRIKEDHAFQQQAVSRAVLMTMGSNANTMAGRGVSGGTSKALQRMNLMNGLEQVNSINKNTQRSIENTATQQGNMQAKMASNVFLPNLQGPSAKPILEDAGMAGLGGMIGGLSGGLSMFAGA